jgi:hypothetical protein
MVISSPGKVCEPKSADLGYRIILEEVIAVMGAP